MLLSKTHPLLYQLKLVNFAGIFCFVLASVIKTLFDSDSAFERPVASKQRIKLSFCINSINLFGSWVTVNVIVLSVAPQEIE